MLIRLMLASGILPNNLDKNIFNDFFYVGVGQGTEPRQIRDENNKKRDSQMRQKRKPRQKYADMHPRLLHVASLPTPSPKDHRQTDSTSTRVRDYRYLYSQKEWMCSSSSGSRTKVADWRVTGRPQITVALIREWMIRWRGYQGCTCKVGICT